MDEAEWLTSEHPMPMLEFIERKVSDRKLRIFATACCRQEPVWRLLNERTRRLVNLISRYADAECEWEEVAFAAAEMPRERLPGCWWNPVHLPPSYQADRAALALAGEHAWDAALQVIRTAENLLGSTPCDLLREIIGNPFRSIPVHLDWLRGDGCNAVRIAEQIYASNAFDQLPALAGALEAAERCDDSVLEHCRQPGLHLRGCWAVDLLTGRN